MKSSSDIDVNPIRYLIRRRMTTALRVPTPVRISFIGQDGRRTMGVVGPPDITQRVATYQITTGGVYEI
jgi:hypothetical protein